MFNFPEMHVAETFCVKLQVDRGQFESCRVFLWAGHQKLWDCSLVGFFVTHPSLKVFRFSRLAMAKYSQFDNRTSLFGLQRTASRKVEEDVQLSGNACS